MGAGGSTPSGYLPSQTQIKRHESVALTLNEQVRAAEKRLEGIMDVARRTAESERVMGIQPARSLKLKTLQGEAQALQRELAQLQLQRGKTDELLREVGMLRVKEVSKDVNRDLVGVLQYKNKQLQQEEQANRGLAPHTYEQQADRLRLDIQKKEKIIQGQADEREKLASIRRRRQGGEEEEESGTGISGAGGMDDFLRSIGAEPPAAAVAAVQQQQAGDEVEADGDIEDMFFPPLPTYQTTTHHLPAPGAPAPGAGRQQPPQQPQPPQGPLGV